MPNWLQLMVVMKTEMYMSYWY